jgi:O-succinylbenzoic acid--CoA ligase
MKANKFHINFKLNAIAFSSVEELLVYAKTLSSSTNQFIQDWFSINDFIEVNTSGSTGKPKKIQLKKEFMINSALATGTFFDLPEKTTALLCMPVEYIAGKMMLVRAFVLGWHLDIVAPSLNPLKALEKKYDFSAMVPMQLQNSLPKINNVKQLIVGGGIVSRELEEKIQGCTTSIFATFGMTETITHIAVKKLNNFEKSKFKLVSNYKILPNISITQDERDCLVIHAPKLSKEKIFTNDVVALLSEKEFKWFGRFDNVINSGGIKLHPELIEKKLATIISQRFFVSGIPDEVLGAQLILVIEGKSSKINFMQANKLSKYEVPKKIFFVERFFETETKKVQRKKTLSLIKF